MKKLFLLFLIVYLVITSFFYFTNLPKESLFQPLFLFASDPQALERVDAGARLDYDTRTVLITRILHNKPLAYLETFLISEYRSLDIPFLFTFTNPLFDMSVGFPMLFPLEFPLFILATLTLIRKWKNIGSSYFYIIPLFTLALFINGLFLPVFHPIKLFPLVITLRVIIFSGMYEFLKHFHD